MSLPWPSVAALAHELGLRNGSNTGMAEYVWSALAAIPEPPRETEGLAAERALNEALWATHRMEDVPGSNVQIGTWGEPSKIIAALRERGYNLAAARSVTPLEGPEKVYVVVRRESQQSLDGPVSVHRTRESAAEEIDVRSERGARPDIAAQLVIEDYRIKPFASTPDLVLRAKEGRTRRRGESGFEPEAEAAALLDERILAAEAVARAEADDKLAEAKQSMLRELAAIILAAGGSVEVERFLEAQTFTVAAEATPKGTRYTARLYTGPEARS